MEYTEEEKKAIENLRKAISINDCFINHDLDALFKETMKISINIVLNLLEKQLEELKLTEENYKNQIEETIEIAKILNLPEDATIEEIYEEVKKIKQFKVYISDMRSGKELLNKYINDSIPKEAIRERIKELEENVKDFEETDNTGRFTKEKCRDYDRLLELKELLGE